MIRGSLTLQANDVGAKQWAQLEQFYVNDNELTGNAPFEWFGMASSSPVLGINMARNRLSGIPSSGISNLGALEELYLASNVLIGTLPLMSNLTSLRKSIVLSHHKWP